MTPVKWGVWSKFAVELYGNSHSRAEGAALPHWRPPRSTKPRRFQALKPDVHLSYDDLLADPEIDAIYMSAQSPACGLDDHSAW